jgi:hypothetical protein
LLKEPNTRRDDPLSEVGNADALLDEAGKPVAGVTNGLGNSVKNIESVDEAVSDTTISLVTMVRSIANVLAAAKTETGKPAAHSS